jgi:hypothetical protein
MPPMSSAEISRPPTPTAGNSHVRLKMLAKNSPAQINEMIARIDRPSRTALTSV